MVSESGNREPVKVLDHGYIKLIETWGSDERIIESARMSTDKGFLGWGPRPCSECKPSLGEHIEKTCPKCQGQGVQGDEKLLRFLYENKHTTPFEMAGAIFEVQAPIMVFREWQRHRTQSFSELSARYTPLPDVNYIPTVERVLQVSTKNKQAQGTGALLTEADAVIFLDSLEVQYASLQTLYEANLDAGVPKELARLIIPVGRYSRMRAQALLLNWLRFLSLRAHPAAQWEIQQYAYSIEKILSEVFPRTMALFAEKR